MFASVPSPCVGCPRKAGVCFVCAAFLPVFTYCQLSFVLRCLVLCGFSCDGNALTCAAEWSYILVPSKGVIVSCFVLLCCLSVHARMASGWFVLAAVHPFPSCVSVLFRRSSTFHPKRYSSSDWCVGSVLLGSTDLALGYPHTFANLVLFCVFSLVYSTHFPGL